MHLYAYQSATQHSCRGAGLKCAPQAFHGAGRLWVPRHTVGNYSPATHGRHRVVQHLPHPSILSRAPSQFVRSCSGPGPQEQGHACSSSQQPSNDQSSNASSSGSSMNDGNNVNSITGRNESSHAAGGANSSSSSSSQQLLEQDIPAALVPFASRVGKRTFFCTMCGKCCTGSGQTWVSEEEALKISQHLGVSRDQFYKQYTKRYNRVSGWRLLKSFGEDRRCIFLRPDNTCAVHEARPVQCSTYPWWPELTEEDAWQWEKENICEGFDHPDAPPTDLAEAARQMRVAAAHDRRRMLATPAKSAAAPRTGSPDSAGGSIIISSSSGVSGSGGSSEDTSQGSWAERLDKLQQSLPREDDKGA